MKNKTLLEKIDIFLNEEEDEMVTGKEEPKEDDIMKAKMKDKDYKAFFMKKMKEWGISSIEELSDEEKKKFFNEIEYEWDEEPHDENPDD